MKKLIIILSIFLVFGCKKENINIPDLPQNSDTSQYFLDEEKATLIISGNITDTIVYVFSAFDDIYKDADNNFTILNLDIGDYMLHSIQCYMPIDTIGIFNCSFSHGDCNDGYFNYCYFTDGNMTGEITKYGKVLDFIEGVVSGSLYNDSLNINFELNFSVLRENDYYY